jgi:hypothetical protein
MVLVWVRAASNMCAMCGCGKEAFMGESAPAPMVDNAGRDQTIRTGNMFSTDSETWTRETDLNA